MSKWEAIEEDSCNIPTKVLVRIHVDNIFANI